MSDGTCQSTSKPFVVVFYRYYRSINYSFPHCWLMTCVRHDVGTFFTKLYRESRILVSLEFMLLFIL